MERYCCSKEVSVELSKRGILLDGTLNIWVKKVYPNNELMRWEILPQKYHDDYLGMYEMFSAPIAEELWNILPEKLSNDATLKIIKIGASYFNEGTNWYHVVFSRGQNLSDLLAEMIIWLYDNNLWEVL